MPTSRRWMFLSLFAATLLLAGCQTPTNESLRRQGSSAANRGDLDAAARFYQRALEQSPADWRAHYHLGVVELKRENYLNARGYLEKAYTIRQQVTQTSENYEPSLDIIADDLAEALLRTGQTVQLANFLNEHAAFYGKVRDYLRKGIYLARAGDHDNALVALRQAQQIDHRDVNVYLAQADFYERVGRRDQALLALRRAYGLAPEREDILKRLTVDYDQVVGPTLALPPERLTEIR